MTNKLILVLKLVARKTAFFVSSLFFLLFVSHMFKKAWFSPPLFFPLDLE